MQRPAHLFPASRVTLAALAIGLLAGCASPPPPTLLSLPLPQPAGTTAAAAAPAASASAPAAAPLVLAVRRVQLPEYLQADPVRYRVEGGVLAEWPGVVWAERLEIGLTRHLAMRLRQALPGWVVCEGGCAGAAPGHTIVVELAPLDYVRPTGTLQAEARWRVAGGPAGRQQILQAGARSFSLPVEPDSPAGQAAAMGAVVEGVTQELRSALEARPASP